MSDFSPEFSAEFDALVVVPVTLEALVVLPTPWLEYLALPIEGEES